MASIIECNLAIICACAPSLKSLFGRYFRSLADRYGSKDRSPDTSKNSSSNGSSSKREAPSSRAFSPMSFRPLKRSSKTKKVAEKSPGLDIGDIPDENSFQETHQFGLEAMSPVAQGYGDSLVTSMDSPVEQSFAEKPLDFRRPHLTIPGTGSFIISPSPSVSSDDEASLVDKKHTHDGLPYGLPLRDMDKPSKSDQDLNRKLEKRLEQYGDEEVRKTISHPWPSRQLSRGENITSPQRSRRKPSNLSESHSQAE